MRFLIVLSAALALAGCGGPGPAEDVVATGLPGAVVLSHGDVSAAGNLRSDMRFRVGSITKTFVAAATLQLVGEGKLSLDEPVPEARGVPLRTLLNHSSGLFNYTEDPRLFEHGMLTQWRPEQLVALSLAHPRYAAPGVTVHYSNTNYVVLGMVIERVTGHPLAQELERRIFRPLKLRDTAYVVGPDVPDLAPGPRMNMSWAGGAGSIVSTARDLERFFGAIPPELKTGGNAYYGFGVQRINASCGAAWGHSGGLPGAVSWVYARGDQVVVVLVDYGSVSASQFAVINHILDLGLC